MKTNAIVRLSIRFLRDERGTSSIEYALLASLIAVAVAAIVVSLGERVRDDLYGKVATALGV